VDHRNNNSLDNRRENLRLATHSQNQHNRKAYVSNTSGYKGVFLEKRWTASRWTAIVRINGKRHRVGTFGSAEEASKAYIESAKRLHGEFASW
jgi:hypothetical protein